MKKKKKTAHNKIQTEEAKNKTFAAILRIRHAATTITK